MRIGIHLPHVGRKAGPEAIRRAAIQAEELGFADAWSSEHIIIPKGAPYPPSAIFYDPVLTLTWAAAFTKRIGLGTSVLVLPMRHPLPLAKELATLQNLSEGRLILGLDRRAPNRLRPGLAPDMRQMNADPHQTLPRLFRRAGWRAATARASRPCR